MQFRPFIMMALLGLLAAPSFAARTANGVALPDCDTNNPACKEWRQAVQAMNDDAGNLGAISGERPAKPARPSPAFLKSLDACIKHQVSTHRMTQSGARARCEQLMSKPGQL